MITSTVSPRLVRGVAELEPTERGLRPHRLPEWVRRQFPEGQLLSMETQPSGARIVLRTAASTVELETHPTRLAYRGAERPRGRVDVIVNDVPTCQDVLDGGDVVELDFETGETSYRAGLSHTTTVSGLPEGTNRVEIWLPHNETLELLELRSDAPIDEDTATAPIWVHHGSSISHGSSAAGPSGTWPAIAARLGGVELRNLGFGGSAMVDPFMARVIRDAPADLITVKFGINVVNGDVMRVRAFVPAVHGFLDTIRDGHPDTPIVLVSAIFCGIHEDTPGPGAVDLSTLGTEQVRFVATGDPADREQGRLTLTVIRDELASLVERRSADPNLHYLDGRTLYGPSDAVELPLPDGLHPGPDAHRRIGERFAEQVLSGTGPFGPTRRTRSTGPAGDGLPLPSPM